MTGYVATAEIEINASPDRIWQALTDPDQIKQYSLGAEVATDWQPGSPIRWRGELRGYPYEDKGQVLTVEPPHRLQITRFSPRTGQPDVPENYHTITYELTDCSGRTRVSVRQDNNSSTDDADHASDTWQAILHGIRAMIEGE